MTDCSKCKVNKYCKDKDHIIECFVHEEYEDMAEQIRADAIEQVESKLYEYGFIWTEHAEKVWKDIAEQLKE